MLYDRKQLSEEIEVLKTDNKNFQTNSELTVNNLKKDIKLKEEKINELMESNRELKKEIDEKTSYIDKLPKLEEHMLLILQEQGLKHPDELINDLVEHSELIPYKGILGGTMGFYIPNKIHVLTEKWVLAYFADGHYGGYMLLEYELNKKKDKDMVDIKWNVIDSYTN